MNYKAFQLSVTTSLLVSRGFDDNEKPIVEIKIYWMDAKEENQLDTQCLSFPSEEITQAFIIDFSETTAKIWCNSILAKSEK
ncbi:hypothetical protein AB670_02534 [Chryseobacterium sp. MOF25P]|uniref:hypothetical protein n=1 Tax=unclassified Chryseobacterium TaxID=2593645 RepID=UPI000804E391|nr:MULTISPECIES: hypothetical protein [unclassified Chryseobacterium]MBO6183084.1 hypothetical protein [Chryseobacterium sp.]OBW41083.1 hypothetical protein AB670_02534 [Chryseobacterium sp. MOF25P]OBW45787.1 hypothetical protein AB671_02195 [Chryseobacterium sp. BGARF1]